MEAIIKQVLVPRFGDESVLEVIEATIGSPQAGEMQVQVLHSVVAGSDVNMRRGMYPLQKKAPLTPGYSMIGRVLENGPGVAAFSPGSLVACLTIYGAQAERMNVPAKFAVPVPEHVDLRQATALILDWMTAYEMLERSAKVRRGQRIFVHGLSGSVGTALLRLGRLRLRIDVFVVPTTTPFITEALRLLFPAGGYQVVDLRSTGNVIFDDLWTTQGGHPEGLLSADLVELFDKLAYRATLASKSDINHDKLYISRRLTRHQKPRWRPLLNETEIVRALEDRGFVETYLENFGFAEQIAAFSKARIVIGPSGSGNLNTIWTRGLYVCEMESFHTTVRQHAYVHASKGLDYSIVFGQADGPVDRRDAGALTRHPWRVNVADVLAAAELAQAHAPGLIEHRGA